MKGLIIRYLALPVLLFILTLGLACEKAAPAPVPPVIDKIEVLLRSGMESTTVDIDPHDRMPQPKIEVKALYTAELTCLARSLNGEHLQYAWQSTGGKIYGSGNKVTWLAPQSPLTYSITAVAMDSGGSQSATVNISVKCCY